MLSDAEIVQRVRDGDRAAYGILVERYERLVRATAIGITRHRHEGEDIAQEVFVIGLKQLDSLRDPAAFVGWLLVITKRMAAKTQVQRRNERVALDETQMLPKVAGTKGLSQQSQELMELANELPPHEQVVVILKLLNGHSISEIADITGRPIGTITKQLSRASERLRKMLSE